MFFEEAGDGTRKLKKETIERNDYSIISASEISRLSNLLMDMQCRSSLPMQMKINNYLADVTSAGLAFMVFPMSLTSDFFVSCVGDVAIDPPIYIKDGSWAALKVLLEPANPHPVAFKSECMDSRLQDTVSRKTFERSGEPFTNFLMVPCYLPNREKPQLVVVLISTAENDVDLDRDLTLVGECTRFVAPTLRNTVAAEEMKEHHSKLKLIITQVDEVARDITNDALLVAGIKNTIEKVLHSDSAAIFLKEDKCLVSNSYEYGRPLDMKNALKLPNLKIPLGVGMTGLVGTTGEIMMTNEAEKEEVYCNVPSTSSHYRKALGFPFLFKEKIFAVGEAYNKPEDYIGSDKIYADIIGKLFGPILKQSLNLRKANDTSLKKELVVKQLGLKTGTATEYEAQMLRIRDLHWTKPVPLDDFKNLDFLPSTVPAEDSINYILAALVDLELVQRLDLQVDSLIRFLLFQKKCQQSFPFRNWFHSFCSFQFLYATFKKRTSQEITGNIIESPIGLLEARKIDETEILAMLMAAVCNGCGYQGTTHRFQLNSGIVLASVYSSPGCRNELYAIQQTFLALKNPQMNFLMGTSGEIYQKFIQALDSMILNTDLVNFYSNLGNFVFSSKSSEVPEEKLEEEHALICQLLMVCSKISDHARIWEHAMEIGDRLHKEFHRSNQSTCATRLFNIPGIDSLQMRAKLQSHFITSICIPAFKILQKEIPGFYDECVSNMETNLRKLDGLFKALRKQELTERGDEGDEAGEYVAPDDDD